MRTWPSALAIFLLSGIAQAQTVYWDFGLGSVSNAAPAACSVANITAGALSQGNNNGTTPLLNASSASSGYAGASGSYNAGAAARTNAFSAAAGGSTYFEFTLTPLAGHTLSVTNLSFGSRSTGTGPQSFCVRSSLDGYATDLASGSLAANSTWAMKSVAMAATAAGAGAAITFRIFGYDGVNASQSIANWRIDDLTVWANAVSGGSSTPPVIEAITPRIVRVGQALSLTLSITPTDGDPITATNVSTSAGISGSWSLEGATFIYTPSPSDVGAQTFTFTAIDKDGASAPAALSVTVKQPVTPAVLMTAATGVYTQDFNTMSMSGISEWDNAAWPLAAWQAYLGTSQALQYMTGSGTGTGGGLYAFGASGSNTDRSLGSLASGTTDAIRYGVAFTNETGLAITNLHVRFTAEQWRTASGITNTLVFEYCVTNAVLPLSQGIWHRVNALCFSSTVITNGSQPVGAVYASCGMSAPINRPVLPGQVVLLCWSDENDSGNDHALGIDDLTVTWSAGTAPDAIPVGGAGICESFDEMGLGAIAELPFLWRIESRNDATRTSGPYAAASDRTANANSAANFTCAGSYNFSATAAGDQAVGGLTSSDTARSVTVFGKFKNATGAKLRRWSVSYTVEKYRNGTSSTAVQLLASTDGQSWEDIGLPTTFPADADTDGYAADTRPGTTTAAERQFVMKESMPDGGVFYLAWQISVASGDSTATAQALGIDDVHIEPSYPAGTLLLAN